MTLILGLLRLLTVTLFGATALETETGIATRFGDPMDFLSGSHLKCTQGKMQDGQMVCAHRTLPCGTVVMLENVRTGRFAVCQVLDRGPYGANLPNGHIGLKTRAREPGTWRGVVDLSPAVASALNLNGRERVRMFYQKVARHLRLGRDHHVRRDEVR
jgi:hypothetical protein